MSPAGALAAVVVGIDDYGATSAVSRLGPLKYSERDAQAVHDYLASGWPQEPERGVVKLTGPAATRAAFQAELARLSTQGPLDLLVVYLSGHGWLDADGRGAFAFNPDQADGTGMLWPHDLDAALHRLDASRVLLFLDCCHAEALLRGVTFFTQLGSSQARLFICSSRQAQRTWEEDRVRHGVFTAFLLDALNAEKARRGPAARAVVDVESELFPYLCEQVPLYVYAHKGGAHQEPVGGGISRAPVRLPVGRQARRGAEATPLQTVAHRVRQVLQVTAIAGVGALMLVYALGYYVDVNLDGRVIVKQGLRELEPLLSWLPAMRLETPFTKQQLSQQPAFLQVQRGDVVGVWPQRSRAGYRLWFDKVVARLDTPARERALLEVTGQPSEAMLASNPHESQAWRTRLFAEAMAIRPRDREQYARWLTESLPGSDAEGRALDRHDPNRLDFSVLDIPKDSFRDYLEAVRVYAALAPDDAFEAFVRMLKLVKQRADHEAGDAEEAKALAAILQTAAWSRTGAGLPAIEPEELSRLYALADRGYGSSVWVSLAYLGSAVDQTRVQRELLVVLKSYDRARQGDLVAPAQELALDALAASLSGTPGDGAVVDTVVTMFVERFGWPDAAPLQGFLAEAASRAPLSAFVKAHLLERARQAMAVEHNFDHLATARILAANAPFLTARDRSEFDAILARIQSEFPPDVDDLAEVYGHLARYRLETETMAASIEQHVPTLPEREKDRHEGGEPVGLRIELSLQPWGTALARMAQSRVLTAHQEEKLRAFATSTPDAVGRQAAVSGLARQLQLAPQRTPPADRVRQRLAAFPYDAKGRALEVEVLAAWLAASDRAVRERCVEQLRALHALETEVEVRQALAGVIVKALARDQPEARS